jgi:hypothetical protein
MVSFVSGYGWEISDNSKLFHITPDVVFNCECSVYVIIMSTKF